MLVVGNFSQCPLGMPDSFDNWHTFIPRAESSSFNSSPTVVGSNGTA